MVFSSLKFIFGFLPIFLIIYYLSAPKYKNTVLFLGSLCFYTFGEPVYILLLLVSVIINYCGGLLIDRFEKIGRKIMCFLFVVYNLSVLGFFKYTNFFIENINSISLNFNFPIHIDKIDILLPLGISFYTFQIVSYLADVCSRRVDACKNIINLGTYLCMFPKLTMGPIVAYKDIEKQIKKRKVTVFCVEDGLKTFVYGLSFKVLIADSLGFVWNDITKIGFYNITTVYAWIGAVTYSLQIYFDFAGYSLMALGLGKMLGFDIPRNFKDPYASNSVTEFWRRWHITLGSWFRNYVYIPLDGNRKGIIRTIFNLFIVWALTGFWHGASWNFVLWGLYFFVFLVVEKLFLKKLLDKTKVISRIYTLFIVVVSWVIFAITDFDELKIYLLRMFPFWENGGIVNPTDYIPALKNYWYVFLSALVFSVPFFNNLVEKHKNKFIFTLIFLGLFWICVYRLLISSNNPFMYFRF